MSYVNSDIIDRNVYCGVGLRSLRLSMPCWSCSECCWLGLGLDGRLGGNGEGGV